MIQRRQFLSVFVLALCAPVIISNIRLLLPRKKVLVLADQTVRGTFVGYGAGFNYPNGEWWEGDRDLNNKLDKMYGTPDCIGMSDADFDRRLEAWDWA